MFEYPKPEPRTKKKPKPIAPMSAKRRKLESQKLATYKALKSERVPFCRGCGTRQNLSHSHRISQNDRSQIANPANLDYYCMGENGCHALFERGFLWRLDNAFEVLDWLRSTDYQRFMSKIFKVRDRAIESALKAKDLPDWLIEMFAELEIPFE